MKTAPIVTPRLDLSAIPSCAWAGRASTKVPDNKEPPGPPGPYHSGPTDCTIFSEQLCALWARRFAVDCARGRREYPVGAAGDIVRRGNEHARTTRAIFNWMPEGPTFLGHEPVVLATSYREASKMAFNTTPVGYPMSAYMDGQWSH